MGKRTGRPKGPPDNNPTGPEAEAALGKALWHAQRYRHHRYEMIEAARECLRLGFSKWRLRSVTAIPHKTLVNIERGTDIVSRGQFANMKGSDG